MANCGTPAAARRMGLLVNSDDLRPIIKPLTISDDLVSSNDLCGPFHMISAVSKTSLKPRDVADIIVSKAVREVLLHLLSGFYPPNLESKSGATSPPVWAQVPPISDSSFPLYFKASSPSRKKVLRV